MEFLAEDNVAGQTLLRLVARGSAIIAELLRLSDHIPAVFMTNDHPDSVKYAPIMFDFRYLKSQDFFDSKIDENPETVELDDEFRETHLALLERFFKLFDSIHNYRRDFTTYLEELVEGVFVQHTVEGILMDVEGRQLMCEALYLYGVMLMLMDLRIPGLTRERMIISYYRYKGGGKVGNVDDVVKLCRSTGFLPGMEKRPVGYPETYFARFELPADVIDMMIGRLRTDDIYNRNTAYPAPEHRSTALAGQAAMLYVLLFFAPDVLHKKTAIMREIVDKHFNDNWVVPFYMGFTVDLSVEWENYKAASAALSNILDKENVNDIMTKHAALVKPLCVDLEKYLTKGVLVEEYVLTNLRKLMAHVRRCNVTLRWIILHRTTVHKKYREPIVKCVSPADLLKLLLLTAQFEFILKEMFEELLAAKESRWNDCKKEAAGRMQELGEYFSGEKALTRVAKNEKLQAWFKQLGDEMDKLDYSNSTLAGRKIASLNQALEEVEEFHQIETSLQVKQFLADTRAYLSKMMKIVNVRESILADLDIVSDFAYAWLHVYELTDNVHERIKADPEVVLLLRATFKKLASILSLPLVRITQCESKDDVSVAEYYSSSLVTYVRRVLDIIPHSVFGLLDQITQLQTDRLRPIPTKLERNDLKDFAQLSERYSLAKATHEVSVFTEGILRMKTTLVGIIKLDPKRLLEDGIRKQLVQKICYAMNDHLVFRLGTLEDFEARVRQLGMRLDGLRQSFEYIQDYINLYGLKIWQEEFSRIVNYYVEQECNSFLKQKIYDWQSKFQSDAIPIPRFPIEASKNNRQNMSVNFMGRLVREVLSQTDSTKTTYIEANQGWYDLTMKEVVGIRTFDLLNRGVGVFGLTGMDRLVCFMIVRDLHQFVKMYRQTVDPNVRAVLTSLYAELHPSTQFPSDPPRLYRAALQRTQKLWPLWLEFIVKIGQEQLVRRQITNELNFSCKMHSKVLSCCLDVMNDALITAVKLHYDKPDSKPYPGNPILPEVTRYLEAAGINNPITKIYITSEPLEGIAMLAFLFVLSQLPKLKWNPNLSTLQCSVKNDPIDGAPFVVGVATLLHQFHSSYTEQFLAYLGQFVRANISAQATKVANAALPAEVVNVLLFLEEYCKFTSKPRSIVEKYVPPFIFDRFPHISA